MPTPLHPLTVGTRVRYHGSIEGYHGDYVIWGMTKPGELAQAGRLEDDYPDGVGYELWPVGVEPDYRHRHDSMHFVRRSSFTVITEEK